MLTQSPQSDVIFSGDQDIQDLYRRLGISTEKERKKEIETVVNNDEYWPPIPTYSVRFSSDESST